MSLQLYKKYNWQCASAELEGWWAEPRALLQGGGQSQEHYYIIVTTKNIVEF